MQRRLSWWSLKRDDSWRREKVRYTRPGKRLQKTNWKDPAFLMGKSTISTGPFSIAICKHDSQLGLMDQWSG